MFDTLKERIRTGVHTVYHDMLHSLARNKILLQKSRTTYKAYTELQLEVKRDL
jgi:hypothetical protein